MAPDNNESTLSKGKRQNHRVLMVATKTKSLKVDNRRYRWALYKIVEKGADLEDPESVKDTLARHKFGDQTKRAIIIAYTTFLKMNGKQWQRPTITITRKLPFIPLEREIDDLIAGSGKKTASFLQLLKETGMRAGEGIRIKWTDIDTERNTITLNEPEKNGNPRIFKVSPKLLSMIERLPKTSQRIFNCTYTSLKTSLRFSRKRISRNLNNPRLLKITFHTLRHWKATMEYHQTKDILHVKELLGHRKLDTTTMYIQIAEALFQHEPEAFTVKVAKTQEEITAHLQVGFEWIGEKDGLVFLRKRK
jgi:integrase